MQQEIKEDCNGRGGFLSWHVDDLYLLSHASAKFGHVPFPVIATELRANGQLQIVQFLIELEIQYLWRDHRGRDQSCRMRLAWYRTKCRFS
jgi:hypothetical protein